MQSVRGNPVLQRKGGVCGIWLAGRFARRFHLKSPAEPLFTGSVVRLVGATKTPWMIWALYTIYVVLPEAGTQADRNTMKR